MHLEWSDIEEENMADDTSDTRQYALKRRALNSNELNVRRGFGPKVKLNVKNTSQSIQNHYGLPSSSSLVLSLVLIINAINASMAPMSQNRDTFGTLQNCLFPSLRNISYSKEECLKSGFPLE